MRIIDYGGKQEKTLLFFPGALSDISWYEPTFEQISQHWHLYVVVYDGHEPPFYPPFSSVEETAREVLSFCKASSINEFDLVYGFCMGGAIANLIHVLNEISIKTLVLDAAITPYQLPDFLCRFILWRDFIGIRLLRQSRFLLTKAFSPERWLWPNEDMSAYGEIQDYMLQLSGTTLWRVFDSSNNYRMPKTLPNTDTNIAYLYGEREKKARAWDMAYIRSIYPKAFFQPVEDSEHGELVFMKSKRFLEILLSLSKR